MIPLCLACLCFPFHSYQLKEKGQASKVNVNESTSPALQKPSQILPVLPTVHCIQTQAGSATEDDSGTGRDQVKIDLV